MAIEQAIEKILSFPNGELQIFRDEDDGYTYVTLMHRERLRAITWNFGFTLQIALDNLARDLSGMKPEDLR